ncbi:MAG: hypothetical protein A2754_03385 [Candidatus Magasanikbacteria bacterium RIFCSPHIGHO2_01_FULL_47_8]|uniref:Uncharacterized protein n=1 Tax=Candidatus Magasanikbacteria bacterium RIFCSPHIGHO2_01_FULL_47_8 TaxID=1798673 RepID=A0A1F6MDS8_9BACT|nr:MAG: hypothetical protein A2754_03385 [Candidatus Magasanikbacteria bacterium RIFCSPHIGHO2_01_FULL_47_8]
MDMLNIFTPNNHNGDGKVAEVVNGSGKEKKVNYQTYVDPTGELDSKKLGWGIWYVEHRLLLYRILLIGLIVLSAIFWLFSLWKLGDYLIFGYAADQRLHQNLSRFSNYTLSQPHFAPAPVSIVSTQILPGGKDKYDAVAEIINPNDHWLVKFNYYFIVGGARTQTQTTFLLPNEDRLVGTLGLTDAQEATLILENITWTRISAHTVPNPKTWQADRLNFEVTDFGFNALQTTESPNAHAITFTFTNNSPFNYVNPKFYVGLYSQDSLVGVLPLQLPSFNSLEVKKIDLRSFVSSLSVDSVKVFPMINVYDPAVYLPPAAK